MALLPNASELSAVEGIFTVGTVYYLSLHSASPGTTGANELTGGSYARQALTFTAGSNSLTSGGTDAAQSFAGMPADVVSYIGVWTAATGGTFLGGGTASVNLGAAVPAGSTVSFAAGQVTAAVS